MSGIVDLPRALGRRLITEVRDFRARRAGLRKGSFAQHGEDRFLSEYFRGRTGRFLDVGAHEPFHLNNTYLLYRRGWTGVNVEPIPFLHRRLQRHRPRDVNLNAGLGRTEGELEFHELSPMVLATFDRGEMEALVASGTATLRASYRVPVLTLAGVARSHGMEGTALDLLSIDTEGFEMEVLEGGDWERFRPELLVVEVGSMSGIDRSGEVDAFILARGYTHLETLGVNRIYRRAVE
jgi:FkbM family methyltransferase